MDVRILVTALLLALVTAAAVGAQGWEYPGDDPPPAATWDSPDDPVPSPDQYQSSLAPYGSWIGSQYGPVWRPAVTVGWRPYTAGYWTWSPYGWTWISSEPWGWTFHYGRWGWLGSAGWVWVPGSTWGPAWVDWNWNGGYVGWAPLSPWGGVSIGLGGWSFVPEPYFCTRHLAPYYVDGRHLPRHVWRGGGGFHRPPDVHRIERVSRVPIDRLPDRPAGSVAPWQRKLVPTEGPDPHRGYLRRADRGSGALAPNPVAPFEGGRIRTVVPPPRSTTRPTGWARPTAPNDGGRLRAGGTAVPTGSVAMPGAGVGNPRLGGGGRGSGEGRGDGGRGGGRGHGHGGGH